MQFLRHLLLGLGILISGLLYQAYAGDPAEFLYPDMFPFVEADAPFSLQTLQNWQYQNSNTLIFSTLFANQGDGLFEIRKGGVVNADSYELLQRVYLNNDFGSEYVDIPIGTAPIPGSPGNPNPNVPFPQDSNVIWFEDFTKFSLHEAPVVDGLFTVGAEVASNNKTSWRLSANRGPLPGYANPPRYLGSDQSLEQRISVGWADLYGAGSNGQSLDITGVAAGPLYWLRQTVDPMDRIHETDETNNSIEILIDLNNPGEAIMFAGEFVRPGDAAPLPDGDLTEDGVVDIDDWIAFKAAQDTPLDGLGPADALALGDLNLDGQHTLQDAILFRQYFDDFNSPGAFATLLAVPEPTTLTVLGLATVVAAIGGLGFYRRGRRALLVGLTMTVATLGPSTGSVLGNVTLFYEDFESLPLQDSVSQSEDPGSGVWTDAPPINWTRDNRTTPNAGPVEFFGWSFLDKVWWVSTADDQARSTFSGGTGTVAVVDPDEYDDTGNIDPNLFSASLTTPLIDVSGVSPGSATLRFNSSWLPEDLQEAALFVRIDGAAPVEVYRWSSDNLSPNYKPGGTNEVIAVGGDVSPSGTTNFAFNLNPAGASTVQLIFDMPQAGNDWWWAIDNVELFAPSTLIVDTATGLMTITGAEDISGYEITGPAGSLDPQSWLAGNLDSKNYGSPSPMTADFNNNGVVGPEDYTIFRDNENLNGLGDANGDSVTDSDDYGLWVQQYGATVAPGQSWETLIANDDQLLEFFLAGSSDIESATIGYGYNTVLDARQLTYTYSQSNGQEVVGDVLYIDSNQTAIPEPGAIVPLLMVGAAALSRSRLRYSHGQRESGTRDAGVGELILNRITS